MQATQGVILFEENSVETSPWGTLTPGLALGAWAQVSEATRVRVTTAIEMRFTWGILKKAASGLDNGRHNARFAGGRPAGRVYFRENRGVVPAEQG